MKRELVYMDSHSSKFWNIEQSGNTYTVTYGRIGTTGQSLAKTCGTEAEAAREAEKLVREKLGKGYIDAAGSGTDATGAGAESAGDLIPPVAFSCILRRDDIGENATTFIGRRVMDYDPEKPARADVIYRFRSDWEQNEVIPHLQHYLETPAARETTGLILGAWHGDDPEATVEAVIEAVIAGRDRLPKLAAIYVGDITSEENEMSWIQQGDLSPLFDAFPRLQFLRARGGNGLGLRSPSHPFLRALTLETGGMDVGVLRSLGMSEFPNLEHLELWLGTGEYGANHTVADLQPLLSGRLFPRLKYLGLRNSQLADELAAVVVHSPLIQRLETLDLSLGVLSDEGGGALLKLPPSPSLKRLNLHHNYLGPEMARKLKNLPLIVDVSRPAGMDDDEDSRFVAVGE